MRINFPNDNHINKITGVLKKEFKKEVPKLSTQKLKNSICQSFGYQNYSDFQLNNSPNETPVINDVLLDYDLTSELDDELSKFIIESHDWQKFLYAHLRFRDSRIHFEKTVLYKTVDVFLHIV